MNPTPGTVTVDKSKDAVAVSCNKAGYLESAGTIGSEFQAMTFGNILFGGLVGVAIDAGSGAMSQYEPSITLTLIPAEFTSDAERDAFFNNMRTEFLAQSEQVVEKMLPLPRRERVGERVRRTGFFPSRCFPRPRQPARTHRARLSIAVSTKRLDAGDALPGHDGREAARRGPVPGDWLDLDPDVVATRRHRHGDRRDTPRLDERDARAVDPETFAAPQRVVAVVAVLRDPNLAVVHADHDTVTATHAQKVVAYEHDVVVHGAGRCHLRDG